MLLELGDESGDRLFPTHGYHVTTVSLALVTSPIRPSLPLRFRIFVDSGGNSIVLSNALQGASQGEMVSEFHPGSTPHAWATLRQVNLIRVAPLMPTAVAESIRRVKGAKQLSVRMGNWLGQDQADNLYSLPDVSTEG